MPLIYKNLKFKGIFGQKCPNAPPNKITGYATDFIQKSLKTYYFWPALAGQGGASPADAHAYKLLKIKWYNLDTM